MTFSTTFLSEFSMIYDKQLFSKHCQNNLLGLFIKALSHIMMHRMRASVYFSLGLKPVFWFTCYFFNF